MKRLTDVILSVLRHIAHALFGIWFILVFAACALVALLAVLLLPGLHLRQHAVTSLTRLIFLLTATGPDRDGLAHLPDGPCVIVANHASYLDGIVMTAVLPPRFSFVIKAEMNGVPLAGFLLRRIDSFFVDRSHAHKSASSARQILRAARAGRALGFFPEGTFTDEPGLRTFHRGAFAAAKAGGMAVIPAAINGTRHILPAERWLPRPGRITVTLLSPIDVEFISGADAQTISQTARGRIAGALQEPDLEAVATAGQR